MSAPPLRRLPPPGRPDAATLACDLRGQAEILSGLPGHADLASELPGFAYEVPDPTCELPGLAYEVPDLACELRDHATLASDLPDPAAVSPPCSRSLTRSDLLYRATQLAPPQLHPPPPLPVQDSARPGFTMPDHHAVISRCWDSRPCVLIDTKCRTDSRTNATTAYAATSKCFTIRVSFELADPPGISLCFVHCPGRSNRNFLGDPLILTSAQAFVLLVVSFTGSGSFHDYFVYTAGPGKPKLHRIPMPFPRDFDHKTVGILPFSDSANGQYSIVIPASTYNHRSRSMKFSLRVFSSKSKIWITKEALLARDSETDYLKAVSHVATEVISVGGGVLGWVDLWWGILLCNVLDENPTMHLLQWPVPEPNMEFFDSTLELNHISPRPSRDVTVVNGLIKFVELKFHEHTANQGWTATIWSRMVSSRDWHKNSTVHSNNVSIVDSILLSQMPLLLPEILGMEANTLTWDQVICTSPTLSLTSDDDIVHLMVKSNLEHPIAFVITVNTKIKALEAVEQCCAKKMTFLVPTYVTSAFSSYLGTTAGPTPANVLEHPYNVAGSNVQDNITVEPPLRVPNEQPKRTHVAASYSLPPAHKDVTKKTFASIVKQGPPTAVVKPKAGFTEPVSIAVEGSTTELERPYIADGSNVENSVTYKQHKRTPVPASSSLPPAPEDGTNKTYASTLKHGLSEPKQTQSDKQEQEQAMFQYHDKYEEAMAALAEMEMRALKAERLLEAALQYQSSQQKAVSPLPSPRTSVQEDSSQEFQPRRINLLEQFSPSWDDKNKGKLSSDVDCTMAKLTDTHDQREETPYMDGENQGETGNLLSGWNLCRDLKFRDTLDQREETPYMDDEKQGETPKLESAWTVVKSRKIDRRRQRKSRYDGHT